MNDPDFWDKIAERAEFIIEDEIDDIQLIMDRPRQRKQGMYILIVVHKFGFRESDSSEAEETGSHFNQKGDGEKDKKRSFTHRSWSIAERARLERVLMLFGFSCWEQMMRIYILI